MFRVLLILSAILTVMPTQARAQAPASVLLEDLTWTELRDDVRAGMTTLIVPIGGTEENGPQMALGKHNVRVKELSGRIARTLGNALVAPVIAYVFEGNYNPPTGHMGYPGTISVPERAFQEVLEGAARSFKQAGFHDVVFLGDHGGTQRGEKAVAERLNREWASTSVRVHAIEEYYLAGEGDEFAQMLIARGYRPDEVGKHAGLSDTSLMLAIDPRLVRSNRLRDTANSNGVNGDPARASAELGQLAVDAIISKTVAAVRKAEERP